MSTGRADRILMEEALKLAARAAGRTSPNPMVGAVIVRDGEVVGRGWHVRAGEDHAEIMALREAGGRAAGSDLIVTLEPCCHQGRTPPCTAAVIGAGIRRVVCAMIDPNDRVAGKGIDELRAAGIEVEVGCMEAEARRLNEFFVVYHEEHRPFVTVKWAMTLDGRTGTDSNHSRWISNEKSRQHVHHLRSIHDAIMIGIGTVLADDPVLNVRLPDYDGRQPIRIVIDGDLAIPRRARMLRDSRTGPVILMTTEHAPAETRKALEADGHKVIVIEGHRRLVDMRQVMMRLGEERILSVLAEGGRQIHTSMVNLGMVDKVVAFVSPRVIGGGELRSPVEDLGLTRMDDAIPILDPVWRAFDEDICLEGYVRKI